ncbi:hypothetical protein AB0939_19180 [Streptomyces sp. NPDC006990]|uniref:hypothetical protein n=1 Tax=unclassified Streptomyces TaxID=2593676 RepID=UPI0034545E33
MNTRLITGGKTSLVSRFSVQIPVGSATLSHRARPLSLGPRLARLDLISLARMPAGEAYVQEVLGR